MSMLFQKNGYPENFIDNSSLRCLKLFLNRIQILKKKRFLQLKWNI